MAEKNLTHEKSTILVVDDSSIIREILCMQIEELGFEVESAQHGRQAVEMIGESPFDLIILDIMMPEMDGYQVLEYLKSSHIYSHIPVIMISDVDEIESIARCIELGAEDYLPKNFNAVILKARIEASLEKKRLRDLEKAYLAKLEEDYISEKQEKERMLQELKIAHTIQQSLLPEKTPELAGIQIAATNVPALQVGGDFFDFIDVTPDHVGLVIADVSGKGVPAALFMALSRAMIRASAVRSLAPEQVISRANSLITEDSESGMFVTLFYAVLDRTTKKLTYVNAGHNQPIHYKHRSKSHQLLEADGIALGVIDDVDLEVKSLVLESEDVIVFYTDGVTEAFNPRGEEYSEERLIKLVYDNSHLSAQELMTKIQEDVFAFAGDEPQFDDITLIILKS